jgi:hypothetical protein
MFIEQVFQEVSRAPAALVKKGGSTKNLWHDGKGAAPISVAKTYEQRIKSVYEKHAKDKVKGVAALLKKAKGKEHELYERVCNKYAVDAETEYKLPAKGDKEEAMWKYAAGEEALVLAVASATKEGVQWAKSGKDGDRKYVDFNKAMMSGTIENISMGGDVGTELKGCFAHLSKEHENTIITAIAESEKPYSSGLHKSFCRDVGHCGAKKAPKASADGEL